MTIFQENVPRSIISTSFLAPLFMRLPSRLNQRNKLYGIQYSIKIYHQKFFSLSIQKIFIQIIIIVSKFTIDKRINQNSKIKYPVPCIFRNFEKSNLKWKIILISVYRFTKKKKTKNLINFQKKNTTANSSQFFILTDPKNFIKHLRSK